MSEYECGSSIKGNVKVSENLSCDIQLYSESVLPFSGLVASVREPSPEKCAVELALGLGSEDVIDDGPVAGPAGEAVLAEFVVTAAFPPCGFILA